MLLPQPRRDYSRDAPKALEGSSSALTNLLSNLDSLVSDGNRNVQSSIDDIREKRGESVWNDGFLGVLVSLSSGGCNTAFGSIYRTW